jgi:hypothetical protein
MALIGRHVRLSEEAWQHIEAISARADLSKSLVCALLIEDQRSALADVDAAAIKLETRAKELKWTRQRRSRGRGG